MSQPSTARSFSGTTLVLLSMAACRPSQDTGLGEPDTLAPDDAPPPSGVIAERDEGRCLAPGSEKLSGGFDHLLDADCVPLPEAAEVAAARGIRVEDDAVLAIVHLGRAPAVVTPGAGRVLGLSGVEVLFVAGGRVEAWVPVEALFPLAQRADVLAITVPAEPEAYAMSEGPALVGMPLFWEWGLYGRGVTIGILDTGFEGRKALAGTELPRRVRAREFTAGGVRDGSAHGMAVAELVHDAAPGADLLLASYDSEVTFEAAVSWLLESGAHIIVTGTGSVDAEPLDGRGAMARLAGSLVRPDGRQVPFVAAAGNYGDAQHYRGTFSDEDDDGLHDFAGGDVIWLGTTEDGERVQALEAGTEVSFSLVWDDWGPDPERPDSLEDYDLHLLAFDGVGWQQVAASTDRQKGAAHPREVLRTTLPRTAFYAIAVADAGTSRPGALDLYARGVGLWTALASPESSVTSPCVGEDVVCVGAADQEGEIELYSSQGPTIPDEETGLVRTKPDMVAPDCVSTAVWGPEGFCGTSAAAPLVAGALALYLGAVDDEEAAVRDLRGTVLDLGRPGLDDVFGKGRVRMICIDADRDGSNICETDRDDGAPPVFL